MKSQYFVLSVFVCLTILAAAMMPTQARAAIPEKTLSISTSAQGGTWYAMGTRLLKEVQKADPKLVMQVQPGGSIVNIVRLDQGKTNLAMTIDFLNGLAWKGEDPFTAKHQNIRFLCKMFPAYLQIMIMKNSGINTFEDMLSKRISVAESNSVTNRLFKMMLEASGKDANYIRSKGGVVNYLGSGQAAQMMSDGNLDVWMLAGNPPTHPKFNEVATSNEISLMAIEQSIIDDIRDKYPFVGITAMPEKTYPGVKGGFPTIATDTILLTNAQLSDEAAYIIVKSFFDNLGTIKEEMKQFAEMDIAKALDGCAIPIHPGAERYYREKGLIK